MEPTTIATILALYVILGVALYVILDGFDLGVGNIFPLLTPQERSVAMSSIAPFWDGNETWLVYGGGMLIAAFPVVYSSILPAIYIPGILLLGGLMLRGVSFEFRMKATGRDRVIWDYAFFVGSVLTSLMEGVILAAVLKGINVVDNQYAGGVFDFLSPLSASCAAAVLFANTMFGAGWLAYKAQDALAQKARRILSRASLILILLYIVNAYEITNHRHELLAYMMENKFRTFLVGSCSVIGLVLTAFLVKFTDKIKCGMVLFLLCVLALATPLLSLVFALWPYAFFPTHTLWDVRNQDASLRYVFGLASVMLPIILAYTAYVYYAFKGKMTDDDNHY